jgi:hypothetical protein
MFLCRIDTLTEHILDMIRDHMLQAEPLDRLTADRLLQHAHNILEKQESLILFTKIRTTQYTDEFSSSPTELGPSLPTSSPQLREGSQFNQISRGNEQARLNLSEALSKIAIQAPPFNPSNDTNQDGPEFENKDPLGISLPAAPLVSERVEQVPLWSAKAALAWKRDLKRGIRCGSMPFESYFADLRDRDFVGF